MTWGDLFCGGGGTTTGAFGVPGVRVLWALNHSKSAIETHQANHPETIHYQADILLQDEKELSQVDGIWMSSECTNHSIAKGGKLLDLGSRSLPMELVRFAMHCNPSVIIVENVREFVNWGPLVNGRPDKKRKGETFEQWVEAIKSCGYDNYEHRFLNAADYGAHTSRLRYFGIFTKPGILIKFPEPTHSKTGENGLPKWKPCREKINMQDYGRSIFEKNLCNNTIKRIEAGLKRFGGDPFILSFYGSNGKPHDCSLKEPLPTITTKDRHAIVQCLIKYGFHNDKNPELNVDKLDEPISTLITTERHALVTQFISSCYTTEHPEHMAKSIDNPIPTITTSNAHLLISQFISKHYNSNGNPESQVQSLDDPAGTITTSNKLAVITQFITRHQNSNGHPEYNIQIINEAISSLTTKEKHALITQVFGDVYFRFISIQEAKELQGFPPDYILKGSKAEQLRHIGNAVVPIMARSLIKANYYEGENDVF